MLCNDMQNVFRGEAVSSKLKKTTKYWYRIFYGLEYEKTTQVNGLLKCT